MEIERKFTIRQLPDNLDAYPHYEIKQAYLCTDPVMRIRKQDSKYIFTYKGRGLMVREEYNLPLTQEAFEKLLPKAEGVIIHKTRYKIPIEQSDLVIELDLFHAPSNLIMAEVEFPDEESANAFISLTGSLQMLQTILPIITPIWLQPDIKSGCFLFYSLLTASCIYKKGFPDLLCQLFSHLTSRLFLISRYPHYIVQLFCRMRRSRPSQC